MRNRLIANATFPQHYVIQCIKGSCHEGSLQLPTATFSATRFFLKATNNYLQVAFVISGQQSCEFIKQASIILVTNVKNATMKNYEGEGLTNCTAEIFFVNVLCKTLFFNIFIHLYDELRNEWVSHIVNKTANFLELDKINKFKVIFDIHHRITAKFILRCYQLRKESLYRI